MDWYVRTFIKASLVWLALGVTLGVGMAANPQWVIYRTSHIHMNLLGFVTMMIFGVAYHVIPRFSGNPLYSVKLATVHWWLANTGLAMMAVGFALRAHIGRPAIPLLATGGALSALGAYTFVYVVWRTIDGKAAMRAAQARVRASQGAALPIAR